MRDQHQRRRADQDDDQRGADDVEHEQDHRHDRAGEPEEDQEDAAGGDGADDELLQARARLRRVDAAGEKPERERVRDRDQLPAQRERGVGDDRREGKPRQRVRQGVAALHGLVPHHQRAGDHDQQHEQRVGDPKRVGPQLADATGAHHLRRRQERLADQLERRVQGVGDEMPEPVVDSALRFHEPVV